MNSYVRCLTLSVASLCAIVAAPVATFAQESSANEPAAIVSVKNIDGQISDIKYVAEKMGYGDQVAFGVMMAAGFLEGVDKKSPMGAVIWFEGDEPRVVGMVPVSDVERLLDTISQQGGMNVEEEGDFIFLEGNAGEMVVTSKNGYAFISDTKDHLSALPSDPKTLLGEIGKEYSVGAKLFAQRIPEGLREDAIEQMRQGFEQAMNEMEGGQMEEMQREANAMQMQALIDLVQNSDQLDLGLGVEQSRDKLVFDLNFTGLEGSKVAKQAAAMAGKSSRFAQFLVDSAAMNMNGFGVLLEEDQQNMKALVASLKKNAESELDGDSDLSADEMQVVKGLLDDMFSLVNSSIESGFIDYGGTLMMAEGKANFVFGGNLADQAKFDSMVEKITDMAKSQNEVALEAESATVAGVKFQKFTMTLPETVEQEIVEMLGETVVMMMGRSEDKAYLVIGTDPLESVETILGASGSNSEFPVRYNLRLLPIMRFLSKSPQAAPVIEAILSDFGSENDRIQIQSKMIDRGQSMHGEMDVDILKMIGSAAQAAQGMGGAEF